ncbi:MAG: AMP-binding protein, partial [Steroidobacteraceae bacterium]
MLQRISDYLAWYAQRTPRAEALVLGTQRMTYEELAHDVDMLSRALLSAGIRAGDRVAMLATPHPDFFILLLATASIGAIWVGLNPRYRHEELAYVLTDSQPRMVFSRSRIGTRDYGSDITALQTALPALQWIALGDDPAPEGTVSLAT